VVFLNEWDRYVFKFVESIFLSVKYVNELGNVNLFQGGFGWMAAEE